MKMHVYDMCVYGDEDGDPDNAVIREFEWEDEVEIVGNVAGRIQCPGCSADGPIPEYERNNANLDCVECKDTGFVWVSV